MGGGGVVGCMVNMSLGQSLCMLLEDGIWESMVSVTLVSISPYSFWHVRFMTVMRHEPCGRSTYVSIMGRLLTCVCNALDTLHHGM